MSRFDDRLAPIAIASRSGFDESVHHGAGVAVGADGGELARIGAPDLVVYPRSSLKPMQAHVMVSLGLDLDDELLAVACASHDGAPEHLAAVRAILARHGFDEADLDNTPARPYGAAARTQARAEGIAPSSLQQNCSGKHAAMLATCRINGWPTDGYLASDHPLQQAITTGFGDLGCEVEHVGVDGCGAPTHAISLADLARAFAVLASTDTQVARAMRGHPTMVAGATRDVTRWMEAVPGLIAKEGAAGVFAAATPDGRATACKIADGSDEARRAVVPAALRAMGTDTATIEELAGGELGVVVLGHGEAVGAVRALEWTACSS